jgi:hypothetical protein
MPWIWTQDETTPASIGETHTVDLGILGTANLMRGSSENPWFVWYNGIRLGLLPAKTTPMVAKEQAELAIKDRIRVVCGNLGI